MWMKPHSDVMFKTAQEVSFSKSNQAFSSNQWLGQDDPPTCLLRTPCCMFCYAEHDYIQAWT